MTNYLTFCFEWHDLWKTVEDEDKPKNILTCSHVILVEDSKWRTTKHSDFELHDLWRIVEDEPKNILTSSYMTHVEVGRWRTIKLNDFESHDLKRVVDDQAENIVTFSYMAFIKVVGIEPISTMIQVTQFVRRTVEDDPIEHPDF